MDTRARIRKIAEDNNLNSGYGTNPMSSSVQYSYYLPIDPTNSKEKKEGRLRKHDYRAKKVAADEVSYCDVPEILHYLQELKTEFELAVSATSDIRAKNFLFAYNQLMTKLTLDESKNSHFKTAIFNATASDYSEEWKAIESTLKLVIDNPNELKVPKDKRGLGSELKIWLEGAYFHACVYARIQEVEKALKENEHAQNTLPHPLKSEKIPSDSLNLPLLTANVKSNISLAHYAVLDIIKEIDGKEALPVILLLLNVIRKTMMKHDPSQSVEPIDFALRTLGESNERQHQGSTPFNLNYIKTIQTSLIPNLRKLINKIDTLKMIKEVMDYSRLLILFMEGVYVRVHFLPPSDPENSDFYRYTKLYKKDVTFYYLYPVTIINKKIEDFEKSMQATQTTNTVKIEEVLNTTATTATTATITAAIRPEQISKQRLRILNADKDEVKMNKVICLKNLLASKYFSLTAEEDEQLSYLHDHIRREVAIYENKVWWGEPAHARQANVFVDAYCRPGVSALLTVDGLLKVFDGSTGSVRWGSTLIDILVTIYDRLHAHHKCVLEEAATSLKAPPAHFQMIQNEYTQPQQQQQQQQKR